MGRFMALSLFLSKNIAAQNLNNITFIYTIYFQSKSIALYPVSAIKASNDFFIFLHQNIFDFFFTFYLKKTIIIKRKKT